MIRKEDIKDSYNLLPDDEKQLALEISANFHYKDGVKHDDGSIGSFKITPRQFLDSLACFAIKKDSL